MYNVDQLEVWNLTPEVIAIAGAQPIFNVVGHLQPPAGTERLVYTLNGGPERAVCIHPGNGAKPSIRLEQPGDFNIDTILSSELEENNRICFRLVNGAGSPKEYGLNFAVRPPDAAPRSFKLDLQGVRCAEEVGQIVDGRWNVRGDERGEACLEIGRDDAGYNRIILFGSADWTTNYEVRARLCVTDWTGFLEHGLGLAFKWDSHLQGDGSCLPEELSGGLALYYYYYASDWRHGQGLRITMGVTGTQPGGHVFRHYLLCQRALSLWRLLLGHARKRMSHSNSLLSQFITRGHQRFHLIVRPHAYTLAMWEDGKREPPPQVVVHHPVERIERGSIGIFAHYCAVRLYEFEVNSLF